MGKLQSLQKKTCIGKGKVTPVQIAFIVNRYLAENNFSTTLSAFQSEAAELFAKTKSRAAPKGLLGLADILDEYVTIKEQKIIVEQEKQRVEGVMLGISAAMETYRSAVGGVHSPPSAPRPPLPVSPIPPPTPSGISPQDPAVQVLPLPRNFNQPRSSPDLSSNPSTAGKRKSSRTSVQVWAPSKKHRRDSQSAVSATQGSHSLPETSRELINRGGSQAKTINSLVHVSQTLLSTGTTPRQMSPSKCSVIASKTIVVSPFKGQGYIAVGKSVCISSPMKSSPQKGCRRDRVKGRLNFDDAATSISSTDPTAAENCSHSSDGGRKDFLDLDIPDFDMDFNFADLLVNMDLDSEEFVGASHPATQESPCTTTANFP